jgi:hypothetical protein
MKASYKVGQFVRFSTVSAGEQYGPITGVMTRKEGFWYEIKDQTDLVREIDVTKAFREVATRAAKGTKATTRKNTKKENSVHAN